VFNPVLKCGQAKVARIRIQESLVIKGRSKADGNVNLCLLELSRVGFSLESPAVIVGPSGEDPPRKESHPPLTILTLY
jgi:hypothetical protein